MFGLEKYLTQEIKYKKLNENAHEPTRGSEYAAGYDLYAATTEITAIAPHTTVKIGTGLAFELPNHTFAAIFARSGLATKQGLRPANCVGVCDSDYRGEYIVAVHNDTDIEQIINPGDRIAQMVLIPYIGMTFAEVDSLEETERGAGGFGSTGA
jgi:dUTP pyrophosphatase